MDYLTSRGTIQRGPRSFGELGRRAIFRELGSTGMIILGEIVSKQHALRCQSTEEKVSVIWGDRSIICRDQGRGSIIYSYWKRINC